MYFLLFVKKKRVQKWDTKNNNVVTNEHEPDQAVMQTHCFFAHRGRVFVIAST